MNSTNQNNQLNQNQSANTHTINTPDDSTQSTKYHSKEIYCGPIFRDFIREKYHIYNNDLTKNHNFLLILYSYEWFNYKDSLSKVKFHPYLTEANYKKLDTKENYLKKASYWIGGLSFLFTYLYMNKGTKLYLEANTFRKMKILSFSIINGLMCLGSSWHFVYSKGVSNLITTELSEYLNLDLDKKLIERDLIQFGILKEDGTVKVKSESPIDQFVEKTIKLGFSDEEEQKEMNKNRKKQEKVNTEGINRNKKQIKLGE
mmetsp:Transcript_37943/g.39415  ORF Transcript_37943/g.39415 Transcript_37943/m.39415 type:complete len:259 (+) Transcript_37943:2-778(+)